MPKTVRILDRIFSSLADAERFFYGIRDKNLASGGDITDSVEFELLRELYSKYCEYTDWPLPGVPIAFYARNIGRGNSGGGGTTQGFVVRFSIEKEQEFSARKAIAAVAGR